MMILPAIYKGTILLVACLGASLFGHWIVIGLLKLIPSMPKSHEDGSKWIGFCERALIALFVCLGFVKETVFIFAIKAAAIPFRISKDAAHEHQKKTVEYMLIGTMISYFVALFLGLIGRYFYLNLGVLK